MGTSLLPWGTLCWGTEYPVTDGTLKVVILPANRRQWPPNGWNAQTEMSALRGLIELVPFEEIVLRQEGVAPILEHLCGLVDIIDIYRNRSALGAAVE